MSTDSKISISSDSFERIKSEVKMLSTICSDDVVKKKLLDLLNALNAITNTKDTMSIEDMIVKKLEETKRSDKDLNANLYILHQNLIRGKISEEDAKRIFEDYLRLAEYNKNNYLL
jgi:hypothetical protein